MITFYKGIKDRLDRVMQTNRHADKSAAAGREFVAAYVEFTHYAEVIHGFIKEGAKPNDHP